MRDSKVNDPTEVSPALLKLAGPVFLLYLLGSAWFVLVAVGIVDERTSDGQPIGRVVGVLAALALGVISLAGWAVFRVKPWSRPLLLWLPVALALLTSALEYQIYGTIGGILLA